MFKDAEAMAAARRRSAAIELGCFEVALANADG
jgi:hypothetical protein